MASVGSLVGDPITESRRSTDCDPSAVGEPTIGRIRRADDDLANAMRHRLA